MESCFLCAKENVGNSFPKIQESQVNASKKPLELVLQHLANCIKIKLVFHENASLCPKCLKEICDYDNLMLKLLEYQRKLTNRLQAIVTGNGKDTDADADDSKEFLNSSQDDLDDTDQMDMSTNQQTEILDIDEFIMEEITAGDDSTAESASENENAPRSRRKQECIVCAIEFNSKAELNAHCAEMHAPKPHVCKICGVSRRDEEYLELHMNIHEGKTENECRYCPKRFSRPVNTIRHMRKHWDKKKYVCEKCGERFSLDNMLYNHRMRHEAEENPLICSTCNQSFKSRKTFNHHMQIHQENRRRHYCTMCTKSFTERYTLKMHMKTHSQEIDQVPQPAQEIDYKETEESVKMIIDENVEVEHRCVICNSKFENKENLERHLQFDHDVILK